MKSAQRRFSRLVSPAALKVLRLTSRITGQKRARVIVQSPEGELLLVWETIGASRWSLPGGGIGRREEPAAAAARELYEELGLRVEPRELRPVVFLRHQQTNIGYDAHIFTTVISKETLPPKLHNPVEIIEARWFTIDNLPAQLPPLIRLSLGHLSK